MSRTGSRPASRLVVFDGAALARLLLLAAAVAIALWAVPAASAATLTLYPTNVDTSGGRTTVWTTLPTANTWAASLASNDSDSTYAHGANQTTANAVYLSLDPTTRTTGTINSVTITALVRPGNAVTGASMRLGIAGPTGASAPEAAAWPVPATATYVTHAYSPPTAPSGGAWNWSEIATLRAWVEQTTRANNGGDRTLRVTQLYVTVDYTPPTYAITSSAGPNGSISPSGTTSVTEGGSQAYSIAPDPGYYLSSFLVDGSPATPTTSYTFSNVTQNHTIAATFAPNPGPNSAITVPSAGVWLSGASLSVAGSATDLAGSGVNRVDLMIQRSDGQYWTGTGWDATAQWLGVTGITSWSYLWPLPVGEEGAFTYTFTARATDNFGVTGPSTSVSGVRVDNVPPSGSVVINGGALYTASTAVSLGLTATDGGSGVAQMRFSNDGSSWSAPVTFVSTYAQLLQPGDGTKTVYVQFLDAVGNVSGSVTDTITLDTAAPTTNRAESPASPNGLAGWYVSPPTVTLTPSEADAVASFGWDGATLTPYLGPLTPAEGTHALAYKSVDLAGNQEATQTVTYHVDTIAPTPSVLSTTGVSPSSVSLSWTAASEGGSGLTPYRIYDGAVLVTATAGTSSTVSGLTPGTAHTFTIQVTDVAGNATVSSPLNVTTPLNPSPTTTFSITPASPTGNGGWYRTVPSVTLSADMPGATYYQWDGTGGAWQTYGGALSPTEGTHTLYFYSTAPLASDEAPKHSAAINVDTVPPQTPSASSSNLAPTSVDLSWGAVVDSSSGVERYEVFDGASLVTSTTSTSVSVTGLTPGSSHSFGVSAVDAAGNDTALSAPVLVTTPLNGAPTTTLTKTPGAPNGSGGWYTSAPLLELASAAADATYYSWVSATGPWNVYTAGISALPGSNTFYFYSVKAGSTDETPKDSGLIRVDVAAPGTPVGSASNVAATSAMISWTAVADSDSGVGVYRVYDSLDNVVATTGLTSVSISSLTPSTSYTYRVRAFDVAGNPSPSSTPVTFTTAAAAAPFPYTVTIPATGGSASLTLSFSSVTTTPSTAAQQLAPRQPVPDPGLVLLGGNYYDVTADPVYSGFIEVTIPYSHGDLNGATESGLQMWHYKAGTGWENVTLSIDTAGNTVTGRTTSLSDFAIFAPTGPQPPVSGVPASSTWSLGLLALAGLGLVGGARRRGFRRS